MTIPKIVHQIAPADKSRWHPLWFKCQQSWLDRFGDFEYKLWNDEEDIDNLVKDYFPEYFEFYSNLPVHIMKIDFARFCMLYHYGGIYADMDMFCYKNFYDQLTKDVYVLEAPYGDVFLENALMASIKGSDFFMQCIKKSVERFHTHVKNKFNLKYFDSIKDQKIITSTCGPDLVCSVFRYYDKTSLTTFSGLYYNNHGMSYQPSYFTKHVMTGLWGKEAIDNLKSSNVDASFKQIVNQVYLDDVKNFVNIDIVSLDDFDFYHDYTKGGYLSSYILDFEKNNIDNDPNLSKNFLYN